MGTSAPFPSSPPCSIWPPGRFTRRWAEVELRPGSPSRPPRPSSAPYARVGSTPTSAHPGSPLLPAPRRPATELGLYPAPAQLGTAWSAASAPGVGFYLDFGPPGSPHSCSDAIVRLGCLPQAHSVESPAEVHLYFGHSPFTSAGPPRVRPIRTPSALQAGLLWPMAEIHAPSRGPGSQAPSIETLAELLMLIDGVDEVLHRWPPLDSLRHVREQVRSRTEGR